MSIPHCLRCDSDVQDEDGEPHFLIVIEHVILCELEAQRYIKHTDVHAAEFYPEDGYALCNIEQPGKNHIEISVEWDGFTLYCAKCNITWRGEYRHAMLISKDHLSHA